MAPPKTSDAVTGAALMMMSFTSSRLTNDRPSDCSKTSCFIQSPYCFQTGSSRFRYSATCLTCSGVAALPAASFAGSFGATKKMTYVMKVTATNRNTAHIRRRAMNLHIGDRQFLTSDGIRTCRSRPVRGRRSALAPVDELELLLVCYLITSALSAMSVFASL